MNCRQEERPLPLRRNGRCRERGQSTVEFAIVLPLMLLVVLAVVQMGLVVVTKLAVTHTAREVARVLVVDPGVDPVGLARQASPFAGDELTVTTSLSRAAISDRTFVSVRVSDRVPTLVGFWPIDIKVSAQAVMVSEQP